ncbi:MAG: tRNA 2-thiouridine(34) synthase MnmA [Oligoflexales bacterium]|nr:tRNA 2-thiouridine(34) synthase MnmA [Oligoflexales bacterium]
MTKKLVAVGMSGGVDSSVAALLLKEAGYDVVGLFMKNWEEQDEDGRCTQEEDFQDVVLTCAKIGIPYYSLNFVEEYRREVFSHFLASYRAGFTPNPDILCNKEIKFKAFYEKALSLGADFIATGHYAQTDQIRLFKGLDAGKDQSYFLYAIEGSCLSKVLFPIGHLLKKDLRIIAKSHGLTTHDKKDSTGICFIGERKFQDFLSQFIPYTPGDFRRLDGTVVGKHLGLGYYTLGQRRHMGLGGEGPPWYVIKKDHSQNVIYVERDGQHPELYGDELHAGSVHWISRDPFANGQDSFRCQAKIRYRQQDQICFVSRAEDSKLRVRFEKAQRAIAPGQSVVFYNETECLGGAVIESSQSGTNSLPHTMSYGT